MDSSSNHIPRILVIDDEPFFLELLGDALGEQFQVSLAKSAAQGLRLAQGPNRPDLILLDITMPEMDGYETCAQLKQTESTRDIPVVFLTARQHSDDELKGLQLGALDYITKPLSIPVVLSRIKTQLALAQQRIALEHLVQERTAELERTKDAIVFSMGEMAEMRDHETGLHLLRTSEYVEALAEDLAQNSKYQSQLMPRTVNLYKRAAPLHDIGKIGVPDSILQKPGKLNDDEWQIMRQHPFFGRQTIDRSEQHIGTTPFIQVARDIAYGHHEKWDGSGYPQGLKTTAIPLSARLMALADVYDALISKRCYKASFTHKHARELIVEQRGTHFDPEIVDSFIRIDERFEKISTQYRDH